MKFHMLVNVTNSCTFEKQNCSVRVSNELGRGSSKAAKFSIMMIVLTSLAIGFVLFLFFLLFRGRLAYIFTESRQVAAAVADLSPLLAFSILLNSIQPVLSGTFLPPNLCLQLILNHTRCICATFSSECASSNLNLEIYYNNEYLLNGKDISTKAKVIMSSLISYTFFRKKNDNSG